MKKLAIGMALATLSAVSVAAAPRNSSQSSIILNAPATFNGLLASAESWEPSLGESVSFTSSFPGSLAPSKVNIQVVCYQDGAIVFVTAGLYDRSFLLGGTTSPWLSRRGAATCRADLYYWSNTGSKMNMLASTEFDAQG